jgi:hypothetical protein
MTINELGIFLSEATDALRLNSLTPEEALKKLEMHLQPTTQCIQEDEQSWITGELESFRAYLLELAGCLEEAQIANSHAAARNEVMMRHYAQIAATKFGYAAGISFALEDSEEGQRLAKLALYHAGIAGLASEPVLKAVTAARKSSINRNQT